MDFEFPAQANLCQYFLTQRLAEGRASHPAVVTEKESVTFLELDELSARMAKVLVSLGVRQETRVLIMLRDGVHFAAAFYGALRLGAVVTMVNPDVKAQEVEHVLRYTRAPVILADASLAPVLAALPADVTPAVLLDAPEAPLPWRTLGAALRACSAQLVPVQVHADDPAIWLFTSGSTGLPKAVVHRAGDFIFNTQMFAKGTVGMRASDVTAGVPKLFFGYATGTNLMFPHAVGATAALFPERSTAASVLAACERHRVTVLTGVPTMMAAMLSLEDERPGALRGLAGVRFMFSAGEALPQELYARFKEKTGVEVLDGIGSAEMFHIYISNRPGDVRPGTLGRLVEGYSARIVDEAETDVAPGDIGTLHIKGKSVGMCYWQDREKSYHTFRGETCVTADKFSRDDQGYYTYHGRADDLLKVGGRWLAPLEVENALLSHPAVAACCVVGQLDTDGLEKPKAFVELRPGHAGGDALAADLKKHVKDKLLPYKYPRFIQFVSALPKNDRGKVDRKALRALR